VLVAVLLAATAAWVYLTSEAGSERVRVEVLRVLGNTLAGRWEAKRLSLSGGIIVLEGVKLFTPDGELVGEIERARLDVALWPLLGKNVVIRDATFQGVRLYLVHDERGLNLVRAVSLLNPSPPSASAGPGPVFRVDVRRLELTDSFVSYPPYALQGVALQGGAVVAGPVLKLDGKLGGTASLEGDTPLPLTLDIVSASETGDQVRFDVTAALADAKLDGALHIPSVTAQLRSLLVSPDVAKRFVPASPLQVPLEAHGDLDLKSAVLEARAGHAFAKLAAQYEGGAVESAKLEAHEVDLSELFGRGQPSRIDVDASGRLADARPASLDGALEASATWKTPDGRTLADLSVDTKAAGGRVEVNRAELKAPGATLNVRGEGSTKSLWLEGDLEAMDLSRLSKALGEFTGSPAPPLGGRGRLEVALEGPTAHLSVAAKGKLDAFRAGSVHADALNADIRMPDLARPFEAQAELDAARLVVAERELRAVHLHLATQGRRLDVEASAQGLADLRLMAQGLLDDDANGLSLHALVLHYSEEDWTLVAPTHLDLGDGFVLDVTRLASADQRLEFRATQRDGRLDAALDAQRVDLAKLPHTLLPASLNLGGRASLHATAVGASGSPQVDAQVSVREGTLRNVSQVDLDLNATYAADRLEARGKATSSMGAAELDAALPVKSGLDGPLKVHLQLDDVALEQLGPLLEKDVPLAGKASALLEATGTAKKPRATLHAQLSDGTVRLRHAPSPVALEASPAAAVADRSDAVGVAGGAGPADQTRGSPSERCIHVERLVLDVQPDSQGRLSAQATGHAFGADAEVKLSTDLTLERLRAKPPDATALEAAQVDVRADLHALDLEQLVAAKLVADDTLAGKISLAAHGTGSVKRPNVDGTVSFERFKRGTLKPLDGELSLTSTRQETRAHLRLGKSVLRLDADVKLPVEALADANVLARSSFEADGELGPLALADVLEAAPDHPHPLGTVRAKVTASGTAAGPKVQVRGTLDHVALGKVPLGHADVSLDYTDAVTALTAALVNESAGRMDVRGRLGLDLSQPALLNGVDWRRAPLSLQLDSKQLELSWLSGLSERVPRVAGTLDATGAVAGTLGEPAFTGHASLKHGALALMGYGEYRDVTVELDGSDEAVTLQQLYAKSSGGFVNLTGAAVKQGTAWKVRAGGETKSLPIIVDDQLKATATLQLNVEGTASATLVELSKVTVPRATIELPEVRSRDLQDLERPANIVLVRNGMPLNATQERKMRFGKKKAAPAPAASRFVMRLAIDAPHNVWVKSSDVQVELGLSDGFRVELDDGMTLAGDVFVKQGRIDVIGRKFEVDSSSTAHFAGPANRAYVNAMATHKNDREGVTVFATVTGQLPQFVIHLTSNPPMSESDIFTLIATGRKQLREGSTQAIAGEQAASVVGAFAASQIKSVLSKKVPIDVLSVEAGTDGFRGTRVEAGKYLTDQLYLGANVRYGADPRKGENTGEVKLEYQFTPHWNLDAFGGDAGAFGMDLVWRRDF
jgi:translocation and assembly module TamB